MSRRGVTKTCHILCLINKYGRQTDKKDIEYEEIFKQNVKIRWELWKSGEKIWA